MTKHLLKNNWLVLGLFIIFYIIIYIIYYPPISGIIDEIGFINQAHMWSEGSLSLQTPEIDGQYLGDMAKLNNHYIFKRHPGRSLTLLPFFLSGTTNYIFLSSLIIHLLLAIFLALILLRYKISPLYSLLILFHPTFSLYSRTIMSDSLAGLFLLIALYLLILRKSSYGVGLIIGIAAVCKYPASLALPLFCLYYLFFYNSKYDYKNALKCLLTGGLCGLGLIIYNYYLFGNPVGAIELTGTFHLSNIPTNAGFYLLSLLLIWPLMLPTIFFKLNKISILLLLLSLFFFTFFSCYYFYDRGNNFIETTILGQRLIQIILPLTILSYIFFLNKYLSKFKFTYYLLIVFGLASLLLTTIMFKKHQQHLHQLLEYKNVFTKTVPHSATIYSTKTLIKLFSLPKENPQHYFWINQILKANPDRQDFNSNSYFAILLKRFNNDEFRDLAQRFCVKNNLTLIKHYKNLFIYQSIDQKIK